MSDIAEQETQTRGGRYCTGNLREPVASQPPHREVAREDEAERDGRIEVRAADMASRVDHRRDDESEDKADTNMGHLAPGQRIEHNGSAAGEYQAECANALGDIGRKRCR